MRPWSRADELTVHVSYPGPTRRNTGHPGSEDESPLRGGLPEAAGQGLEPRLPDPESGVLPLDDPAGRRHCSRALASVLAAAVLRRRVLLRSASRCGHHRAVFLDDVARICRPVFVALHAAARIALAIERVDVALLLVRAMLLALLAPPAQHGTVVPRRGYTEPPRRIRLVA